jgi:hypothetical protein
MLPEVPVAVDTTGGNVEFRFEAPLSIFMLIVSHNDEVVWELLAEQAQERYTPEFEMVSITPVEQAPPEMLEMVRQAEQNFLSRMREGPPATALVSRVRYGTVPRGYRERSPAVALTPGRYDFTFMCAQGQASGEFDVPTA